METESSLYSFKTYNRGNRLQSIDESYQQGIAFQDTPIKDAHANMLVNFDMKNHGDVLVTRPALQVDKLYKLQASSDEPEAQKDAHAVKDAMIFNAEARNKTYYVMRTRRTRPPHTNFFVYPFIVDEYNDIPGVEATNTCYSYPAAGTTGSSFSIHGMTCVNIDATRSLVYTKAWNGNYYFFNPYTQHSIMLDLTDAREYVFVDNPTKKLTPKEAVAYGYNMLDTDPYHFTNTTLGSGLPLNFTGILPYAVDGGLLMTPVSNQDIVFEAFYEAPVGTDVNITWEWRSLQESTWNKLGNATQHLVVDDSATNKITCKFSPPLSTIILRVTATETGSDTKVVATLAVGFNFKKEDYGATANVSPKNYNIGQASGMCFWKNRLVVWGVPGADQTLFMSAVNDPTYFPYPNNVTLFDEDIITVVPFGGTIIVFTTNNMYSVALSEDGLYCTSKILQRNIHLTNAHLVTTINNMVFFQSGNYFYMLVPKRTSTTGETVIASISDSIKNLLDNFKSNIMKIIEDTYLRPCKDLELVTYYDFIDYEDIHISYVFKSTSFPNTKINMHLIYNIIERNWRIYFAGTDTKLFSMQEDLTQRAQYMFTLTKLKNEPTFVLERLVQNYHSAKDHYLTWDDTLDMIPETVAVPNWQRLDTGYREQASNFKKRYRELQFMVNNLEDTSIRFYTNFFIDGVERQSPFSYEVVQDQDPNSDTYGLITVEKNFIDNKLVPGNTILAETLDQYDHWTLDVSSFPDRPIYKVRFPVSGKGYTPRLIIGSINEKQYELLNVSWVYRPLYSR